MNETIPSILSGKKAFCLIQKQDSEEILVLLGTAGKFDYLKDIPRKKGTIGDERQYDTISIVPFCQIKERGFEVHDQGEKIRTIEIEDQLTVFSRDLLRLLPCEPIELNGGLVYDTTEDEYGEIIRKIVSDEIGEGEGANFVIPRSGRGALQVSPSPRPAASFQRWCVKITAPTGNSSFTIPPFFHWLDAGTAPAGGKKTGEDEPHQRHFQKRYCLRMPVSF